MSERRVRDVLEGVNEEYTDVIQSMVSAMSLVINHHRSKPFDTIDDPLPEHADVKYVKVELEFGMPGLLDQNDRLNMVFCEGGVVEVTAEIGIDHQRKMSFAVPFDLNVLLKVFIDFENGTLKLSDWNTKED